MKNQQTKPIKQIQTKPCPQTKPDRQIQPKRPLSLRFSPTAWAKLLYFRDKSGNEVGGFAVTPSNDLLFVKDFVTVKQEVTSVSVKFDDAAVADFFENQVDLGRKPEQFARIWLHSHPGDFCTPSLTDEDTFAKAFGGCQWAVMAIVAQNSKTYARLSFNIGPGGQLLIPVEIDYSFDFASSDHKLWDCEYYTNVQPAVLLDSFTKKPEPTATQVNDVYNKIALPYDVIGELEKMEPAERQFVLDELAERPDLWDESEVMFI